MDNPAPLAYFAPLSTAVLVDGSGEVWAWQNGEWVRQPGSASNTAIGVYSIGFDGARGQLVLLANATYVWDGTTWKKAA